MLKNKRGVSEIIGYVLLIVMVISLSFIVYRWMASYIPKDYDKCPDDVSVFIKDKQCQLGKLLLTLGNNGLFNVEGYYAKATILPDQEVATLSLFENEGEEYVISPLNPGDVVSEILKIAGNDKLTIYSIEIMPVVLDEKTKDPLVCGNAKIKEKIQCEIGDNLLANHDFESWSGTTLSLWSAPLEGTLSQSSDKVNGFSSLQIVKSSGYGYITGQTFNVQPGETYYYEIYMKKNSGTAAWMRIVDADTFVWQSSVSQANSNVWEKFSGSITIPAGVTQIRFELGGSSMTALYDSAVLRKV